MAKEGPLKFVGTIPYPPLDKVDDWGLNAEQQETEVEKFRRILESKGAWRREDHDYYLLLRFLRARNYELDKATKMWQDTLAWRKEFDVDTILDKFVFHEKDQFLTAYPQGYHKTDKLGRPIYIQLLGQININTLKQITTEERMVKFHIQEYERCGKVIMPICSKLAGRQIDQTFGIMDVKGVGMSHLTGEVKRLVSMLTKYDQDNYPEMLGRICIINAPMVFKAVWALIKPLLNPRTLSKIQICQSNYKQDLLQWVAPENLPDWLGGTSKGTLLDDMGPWSDPEVLRRFEAEMPAARAALKARGEGAITPVPELLEDADGYASPRSEASFVSIGSSLDASLGRTGSKQIPAGRIWTAHDEGVEGASASDTEEAGGSDEAGGGAGLTIAALNAHRNQSLMERITRLEQQFWQHTQRLKGYVPTNINTLVPRATPGSLLQRVEVLEQGLDLLLRAQDLDWQAEEQRRRRACCGGCTIC